MKKMKNMFSAGFLLINEINYMRDFIFCVCVCVKYSSAQYFSQVQFVTKNFVIHFANLQECSVVYWCF